jgi:hypothetical protein
MKKSSAETWVKVICILGYIGSGFAILGGILMFFGGTILSALVPLMPLNGEQISGALFGAALIIVAIVTILLGLFGLFVYLNLWKHKNWARIILIIFSVIGAVSALFSLPGGIIGLVIWGGIFYLLALNKDVKDLF